MDEKLTNELVKKLLEIKGEVRGVVFKTDFEYVLKNQGERGIEIVEKEFEKLNYPLKYKEIQTMNFYPIGLRAISLLVIKKVLNLDDEKIKEMGFFATKRSLMVKIFVKYFLSLERVFLKEAPALWKKHYTVGNLIPVELSEKEKYAIFRLKNFNIHPIVCKYLGGYFCGITQMIVNAKEISFEETKCSFLGNDYHEFLIKWK